MRQANFKQKRCVRIIFRVLLFLAVFAFTQAAQAQVTIGSGISPHKDALLDLKEDSIAPSTKGLLFPRVALKSTDRAYPLSEHVTGMTVYNTTPSDASAPDYSAEYHVSKGFYYNTGQRWERLNMGATSWFYMPSIPIKTSESLSAQTLNLYDKYKVQFSGASGNFAKSPDAPSVIPYFPASTDLYYYITDYDPAVFSNVSIDNNGVMTYDVTAAATDYTFINIVFVLK